MDDIKSQFMVSLLFKILLLSVCVSQIDCILFTHPICSSDYPVVGGVVGRVGIGEFIVARYEYLGYSRTHNRRPDWPTR